MRRLAGLAIAAALAAAACSDTTPTTPTTPNAPTITDSFSGRLTPNGGQTHTFITATSGTLTATLVSISPDSSIIVGMSLGTWNGNACQILLAKDNSTQGSVLTGAASAAGNLCVRIYDVGNLTGPEDYDISVLHP